MFNPFDTYKRIKSRIGKPVRPIIELQKGASVVNIVTTTIQTESMIQDTRHGGEAWEVHPEDRASAIYYNGVFQGMGFFVTEEGVTLQMSEGTIEEKPRVKGTTITVNKEVELWTEEVDEKLRPVLDDNGQPKLRPVMNAVYKGVFGKLLDGSIIERGSALKPSMTQTLIYCCLIGLTAFFMGMRYAG